MNGSPRRRRPLLRFSVSTLLILVTCLCCYLAGRSHGYRSGRAVWKALPVYTVAYAASDLLDSDSKEEALEEVASAIKHDVMSTAWEDADGKCSIEVFAGNGSLIVAANRYVHERLTDYTAQARESRLASR